MREKFEIKICRGMVTKRAFTIKLIIFPNNTITFNEIVIICLYSSVSCIFDDFLVNIDTISQFSLSQVNYLIKSIKYNPYTFDRKIKNATIQAQN